jgi:hypothetical protein
VCKKWKKRYSLSYPTKIRLPKIRENDEKKLLLLKLAYISLKNGKDYKSIKDIFEKSLTSWQKHYLFVTQYNKNSSVFKNYGNIPLFEGKPDKGTFELCNDLTSKYYLSNDALLYYIEDFSEGMDGIGTEYILDLMCETPEYVIFIVVNIINPNNCVKYNITVIDKLVELVDQTIYKLGCVGNPNGEMHQLIKLKNNVVKKYKLFVDKTEHNISPTPNFYLTNKILSYHIKDINRIIDDLLTTKYSHGVDISELPHCITFLVDSIIDYKIKFDDNIIDDLISTIDNAINLLEHASETEDNDCIPHTEDNDYGFEACKILGVHYKT